MRSALLLLGVALYPFPIQNQYQWRLAFGFIVILLEISILLSKRFHWSLGAFFFSSTAFGLFQWLTINDFFLSMGDNAPLAAAYGILGFIVATLIFSTLLLNFKFQGTMDTLFFIAVIDSLIMIFRHFNSHIVAPEWWVMSNAAMDSSFVACMIPLALREKSHIYAGVMLSAIVLAHGNTGVFGAAIALVSYFALKGRVWPLILSAGVVPVGAFFMGHKFLGDSGRFAVWKMTFNFWNQNSNQDWWARWVGFGPGTYSLFGPTIQSHAGYTEIFQWAHNEYLQVLFENGILGLSLILILALTILYKTRKNPCLFAQVLTFCFISITQFTGRVFFTELLGVTLLYHGFTLYHLSPDTVSANYLLDSARRLPLKSMGLFRLKGFAPTVSIVQSEKAFQKRS